MTNKNYFFQSLNEMKDTVITEEEWVQMCDRGYRIIMTKYYYKKGTVENMENTGIILHTTSTFIEDGVFIEDVQDIIHLIDYFENNNERYHFDILTVEAYIEVFQLFIEYIGTIYQDTLESMLSEYQRYLKEDIEGGQSTMTDLEKQELNWYRTKCWEYQKEISDLYETVDRQASEINTHIQTIHRLNHRNSQLENKINKLTERN